MSAPYAVKTRARRALTALTVLLTLGLGTVAGAAPASAAPALNGSFADAVAGNILHMINAERAAYHLPPVQMNWRLRQAAFRHNQVMYTYNTMSHQLRGEPDLGTRISKTGFHWTWAGENVGWNSDMSLNGVRYLETVMINEKPPGEVGHRLNILNPQYRYVGIDIRWDFIHHKAWLTEDFARNA